MMKKIVLAVVMAVMTLGANAQFEKGTKYANLSLTGFDMSYQKGSKFHFGLQGQAGYFVEQNWMVGGLLGYDYLGGGPNHEFNLGANGRYYFDKCGIFVGAGLLYSHQRFPQLDSYVAAVSTDPTTGATITTTVTYTNKKSWNFFSIPLEAGYCFYINNHLSIEPAVYCHLCLNHFDNGSKVGLKVGVGYYF